jgi:hypothetical protein
MGGVVNILVRQVKGDDLAVACVNANVQLAPSAALCRAMFFKQPFAGPAQFQSCADAGGECGVCLSNEA